MLLWEIRSEDIISKEAISAGGGPPRQECVFVLTSTAGQDLPVCKVLTEAGLSCRPIAMTDDLAAQVRMAADALLVEQAALTPQVAEALFSILKDQPIWSDLPVVLLATPGTGLPACIHDLGSVLVLEQPFRQKELVCTIRAALRMRRRQYEVRDQLAERDRAQQALRERDRKIHEILEATGDFFFAVDRQWRFTYVNQQAAEYFGRQASELIGQIIWEAIPLFVGTVFEPRARRAMHEQVPVRLAGVGPANGRWCEISIYPTTEGLSIYGRDIHERKMAEQALIQRTRNLRELADLLDLANGLVLDLDGRIVHWNKGAERLYGFTPAEAIGQISHDLLQTHFPEPLERILAQLFETGRWEGELTHTHKDGRKLMVASLWVLHRNPHGEPVAILEAVNDITARRQAEEALRQSEQAYRRLFDNRLNGMAHGRMIMDDKGRPVDFMFLEVNDTFERMTGLKKQHVVGRRLMEAVPDMQESCFNPIAACAQVAMAGEEAQFEFEHEDTKRWYSVYLYSPRKDEFIGVFTDISPRKQAEQRLQELNETLERRVQERTAEAEYRAAQLRRLAGELTQAEERERRRLAQVLHDHLQQLLIGTRMSLSTLKRQLSDPGQRQAAQQMDELLDQSIATSRSLTAELSPPVLYEAGLAQALDWLAGWMRDKHGLVVTVQADPAVNPREKVRVLLFQVVRELLFNVVKHANTYQASVRMHRNEQQVEILVEDAGTGFDPQQARPRLRPASGLGLFSIRERLEWLGGRIAIDSAPGKGTRVQILAPLQLSGDERMDFLQEEPLSQVLRDVPAGRQQAAQPAGEPAEGQAGRIRVLLADDHAVMRDGLAQLLQTQPDIEVVAQAADGQEAVDLTAQLHPDVVLMDVTMPRLSGIEATRQIKQRHSRACVIGLSMHVEEDMATAMRSAGASDYLTKSADPEELIATIYACRR